MLVIRVRERSTRHQVLRDVFGYHDNTVRKLPMDAGHNDTLTPSVAENDRNIKADDAQQLLWPWLSGMVGTRQELKRKMSPPASSLPQEYALRLSVNQRCSKDSSWGRNIEGITIFTKVSPDTKLLRPRASNSSPVSKIQIHSALFDFSEQHRKRLQGQKEHLKP